MRLMKWGGAAVLVISLATFTSNVKAVSLGQVDDFEDGGVMDWFGHTPSITNIPSGGPAGGADNFLQVVSSGTGRAGSRMVTFNNMQWAGDYVAAGVSAITADVNNLGNDELDLRVSFSNGTSWYVSTNSFQLPAASGWQTVNFDLSDVSLLSGAEDVATTLSSVTDIRILSSQGLPPLGGGGAKGDPIAAELGLDNIKAVPEPGGLLLAGLGVTSLGLFRRRFHRHHTLQGRTGTAIHFTIRLGIVTKANTGQ